MRSKRYIQTREKLEADKTEYDIAEAIEKIKNTATAKFDETVEIAITLGVDPTKSDQMVRGSVSLPFGTGKEVKIAVVVQDEKDIESAKNAGADLVGKEDVIAQIKKGNIDFDVLISSPECMKELGKYGKVLGPKGLMPSPKTGTITKDIANTVDSFKKGRIEFKMDKNGIIHGVIGKVSFQSNNLIENFNYYVDVIKKNRPSSAKGKFIKNIFIASTMGPSVEVKF